MSYLFDGNHQSPFVVNNSASGATTLTVNFGTPMYVHHVRLYPVSRQYLRYLCLFLTFFFALF